MPVEHHHVAPSLRRFLESYPDMFMRCDMTGRENPIGEYWCVREEILRTQGCRNDAQVFTVAVTGYMEEALANSCVTDKETTFGYWWRYQHSENEAQKTLDTVVLLAQGIGRGEAYRSGKTYLVALIHRPVPSLYVFARDHPDALKYAADVVYELTPSGVCFYRNIAQHY